MFCLEFLGFSWFLPRTFVGLCLKEGFEEAMSSIKCQIEYNILWPSYPAPPSEEVQTRWFLEVKYSLSRLLDAYRDNSTISAFLLYLW